MKDCLFCKIVKKEIPSDIVYEDSDVMAFLDIHPQAPTHVLIIPKKHLDFIADLSQDKDKILGKLVLVAGKLAKEKKLDKNGYRLIFNQGAHAGQEVDHIHLHLLGGRPLGRMVG